MSEDPAAPTTENFSFTLKLGGEELQVSGTFPPPGSPSTAMVPLFLAMGEAMISAAIRERENAGAKASCGPGCGACCRQLVPISLSESAFLRDEVIPSLPTDQRQRVEARIKQAAADLADGCLAEEIAVLPANSSPEARQAVGLRYFLRSIPCPFLENESCGIHPMRPLACREYLVTSPASRCARPHDGGIEPMKLPVAPSHALIRMDARATGGPGWAVMTHSLIHPRPARTIGSPGSALEEFLNALAGLPPESPPSESEESLEASD